jgi:L-alanine-DL-glutamate epimerase-like enolase superfamily enzyme
MPVISSIHAGDPEDMRRRVAEHLVRGDLAHSVKIGDDPGLDAARIEAALADRRPGEFFIVDANGGMTRRDGVAHAQVVAAGS